MHILSQLKLNKIKINNLLRPLKKYIYTYAPNELIFLLLSALKGDIKITSTGRI